jgi:UDP-N-acetylmuramoyl-L-alanyl-D-glutamate--2,6-diaminopimelate ligase
MKFEALMTALPDAIVRGARDLDILRIVSDSRQVVPGDLFAALPAVGVPTGIRQEGGRFVSEAVRRGAVAVLTEDTELVTHTKTTWVTVPDARAALSLLAARFFGDPSGRMKLIGVTGTNGKTTTTFLIRAMLKAAGFKTGMIGTISHDLAGEVRRATHTTPDALSLQRLFSDMRDKGVTHVAMEVSSHALDQRRVEGCRFQAAVFTNLTQDHLDYHGDMETYFTAKRRLFDQTEPGGRVVVNLDDSYGRVLQQAFPDRMLGFGMTSTAEIHPLSLASSGSGIRMSVATSSGALEVVSPLIGRHNAYNILAAVGVGVSLSLPHPQIAEGIADMSAVPGRFEKIDVGQDFLAIVDYAHTEDALCRLLSTAADLSPRRIITVFGCGGDRDREKRPRMGNVAARMSDYVIITSDNPRSEPPLSIIGQIEAGVKPVGRPYQIIPDRREAIFEAVRMARSGEMVVVAGKGHETVQIIGNETLPFDDREVLASAGSSVLHTAAGVHERDF